MDARELLRGLVGQAIHTITVSRIVSSRFKATMWLSGRRRRSWGSQYQSSGCKSPLIGYLLSVGSRSI